MRNDNRDQGRDTQQNPNRPAQGKDDMNKNPSTPGKDAHLDPKSKPLDPSAKKTPENFVK